MRADNGSGYAYDAQGYQGYAAPGAGVGGVQGATQYGTYGATGASDAYAYDDGTQVGRAEPGAGSYVQGWGLLASDGSMIKRGDLCASGGECLILWQWMQQQGSCQPARDLT